ncbi:hypothetical protein CY35_04G078000 [Sphagnum magellanicum]|nr:hypothetical protein CY35_04G078000 [Sphagnum magellanicum]
MVFYLYHEGWKKIDYQLHLVKLLGVHVRFIPGNRGSYKQMPLIAAESDKAYNGGPLDGKYYQHSSFTPLEAGLVQEGTNFLMEEYTFRLSVLYFKDLGQLDKSLRMVLPPLKVNGRNMGLLFKLAEEWLTKAQIELKHTLTLAVVKELLTEVEQFLWAGHEMDPVVERTLAAVCN